MNRPDKLFLNFTQYIVLITSIIYFVIKTYFKVEGEWGVEPHHFEKTLQHIHILLVPFLVFCVASIFKGHIWKKYSTNFKNLRKTGISLLCLFFAMIFSGYAIQVSMDNATRSFFIYLHLATSVIWSLLYIYHQVKGGKYSKN